MQGTHFTGINLSVLLIATGCTSTAPKTTHVDLMVTNGQVLTMDKEHHVYPQGVVVINGDTIIAVGDASLAKQYSASKVINAKNGIVLPGMVNTHNHLPMIAFRGLGEEGIENRLFAYFFPLEKEKLSRTLIHNATLLGASELALGGVTTYADMYYHMDEMAQATKQVGLRAVLGETVIKYPVVDAPTPYGGLEYGENFVKTYLHDPLITPAFAPHAAYTVGSKELQRIHELSVKYNVPTLIHAAEFPHEEQRLEDGLAAKSPVDYLYKLGVLDKHMVLAHGVNFSEDDLKLIQQADAGVAYNPMANAKGATGIAPAWDMLKQHIRIGLGTDGPMSSNQVDLWRTLSYAANMQRLRYHDRTIMIPRQVIEMATIGGAKALHMEDQIGSLEPGKKADVIVVETHSMNMMPNYNPYATLVYQANPSNVEYTIVNGKIVMANRKLTNIDEDEIRTKTIAIENDIRIFAQELAKKAIQSKSVMD